jgi:NADH-quinone oxidoreductase subunit H
VQTPEGERLSTSASDALRHYLPYDAAFVRPVTRNDVELAPAMDPATGNIVGSVPFHVTYRYHFQIAHLNIGVLFVLASLSLAVYGVVIGGWASNNKYSFLGGLRATANMISYEIPLGLSVLVMIIMFSTLDLAEIVDRQATYWAGFIPAWNMFAQPLPFLLFLICIHAEANRAPFDMAEAEQELVGGYHTEYSSMRFALFFLAEYAGMITTSCVLVALFWGGWQLPWIEWLWSGWTVDPEVAGSNSVTTSLLVCIIRSAVFFGKAILVLFIFMWVRWSLPRFRFDQLMQIAWKGLIPILLVLVVGTTLLVYAFGGRTFDGLSGWQALGFLAMNAAALAVIVLGSFLVPAGENQNVRVHVPSTRFGRTPLPAGVRSTFMPSQQVARAPGNE